MATTTSEHTHPVSGAVASMLETLAGLADVPLWSMTADETADTVRDLARLRAAVAELELRTAAHADVVEAGAGTRVPTVLRCGARKRTRR